MTKKPGIHRIGYDLASFRPAYLSLQLDMERLSRLINPSYLAVQQQMGQLFEPIRQQHLEMIQAISLASRISPQLAEIARANQRWQDLIAQDTPSARILEDFGRAHQTWLAQITPIQDIIAQLQAMVKLSLVDVAYRLTITEQLSAGIDFDSLHQAMPKPAW
jgi:hypothetical protein